MSDERAPADPAESRDPAEEALDELLRRARNQGRLSPFTAPPASPESKPPGLPKSIGRFEILEELGRGGMGVVYRARCPQLGREVALKVLRHPGFANELDLARFEREAKLPAQLRHPNISRVLELGIHEGAPYLVLELIPGPSLAKVLEEQGPVEPRRAARLAQILADALEHAHQRGIVHRDVKPGNVILRDDGEPVLTDFGLAKALDDRGGVGTQSRLPCTPAYAAPEVLAGRTADRRSDIFSLGMTLVAMLEGQPRLSPAGNPSRPIDHDLQTIRNACLAEEPDERYPSAAALAADLGNYLSGRPLIIKPPSPVKRLRKWVRRNRRSATAAGVVGLLGLSATLLAAWGDDLQRAWTQRRLRQWVEGRAAAAEQRADRLLQDPAADPREWDLAMAEFEPAAVTSAAVGIADGYPDRSTAQGWAANAYDTEGWAARQLAAGRAALERGEESAAEVHFGQAVRLDPQGRVGSEALLLLAERALGERDAVAERLALRYLVGLRRQGRARGASWFAGLRTLAHAYTGSQRYERALGVLELAGQDPGLPAAARTLLATERRMCRRWCGIRPAEVRGWVAAGSRARLSDGRPGLLCRTAERLEVHDVAAGRREPLGVLPLSAAAQGLQVVPASLPDRDGWLTFSAARGLAYYVDQRRVAGCPKSAIPLAEDHELVQLPGPDGWTPFLSIGPTPIQPPAGDVPASPLEAAEGVALWAIERKGNQLRLEPAVLGPQDCWVNASNYLPAGDDLVIGWPEWEGYRLDRYRRGARPFSRTSQLDGFGAPRQLFRLQPGRFGVSFDPHPENTRYELLHGERPPPSLRVFSLEDARIEELDDGSPSRQVFSRRWRVQARSGGHPDVARVEFTCPARGAAWSRLYAWTDAGWAWVALPPEACLVGLGDDRAPIYLRSPTDDEASPQPSELELWGGSDPAPVPFQVPRTSPALELDGDLLLSADLPGPAARAFATISRDPRRSEVERGHAARGRALALAAQWAEDRRDPRLFDQASSALDEAKLEFPFLGELLALDQAQLHELAFQVGPAAEFYERLATQFPAARARARRAARSLAGQEEGSLTRHDLLTAGLPELRVHGAPAFQRLAGGGVRIDSCLASREELWTRLDYHGGRVRLEATIQPQAVDWPVGLTLVVGPLYLSLTPGVETNRYRGGISFYETSPRGDPSTAYFEGVALGGRYRCEIDVCPALGAAQARLRDADSAELLFEAVLPFELAPGELQVGVREARSFDEILDRSDGVPPEQRDTHRSTFVLESLQVGVSEGDRLLPLKREAMERAGQYYLAGRYRQAAELYQRLAGEAANGGLPRLAVGPWLFAGSAWLKADQPEPARKCWNQALRLGHVDRVAAWAWRLDRPALEGLAQSAHALGIPGSLAHLGATLSPEPADRDGAAAVTLACVPLHADRHALAYLEEVPSDGVLRLARDLAGLLAQQATPNAHPSHRVELRRLARALLQRARLAAPSAERLALQVFAGESDAAVAELERLVAAGGQPSELLRQLVPHLRASVRYQLGAAARQRESRLYTCLAQAFAADPPLSAAFGSLARRALELRQD